MKKAFHTVKHHTVKATRAARASLSSSIEAAPPELRKRVKKFLIGSFLLIVVIVSIKWVLVKKEERERLAEIAAGPKVKVTQAVASPGTHTVTLIGETRPYAEATLYAKVSGYLKTIKVDKGDRVKEGQVLAIIESPETDQAFIAAGADAKNKRAIAGRMNTLLAKKLVSQQEADQAVADADVASARLTSAETLKSYETIRAPFAGTVTARYADPGALVQNATSSQTSALPIVTVSTLERLRVDVFVDQHDAPYVAKDAPVEITLSDRPGFKLSGQVSRVSGSLDATTKMLLTEIDILNKTNDLVAGSFVQVALTVKSPPYIQAPVESLVMKNTQAAITVVDDQNLIHYQVVDIANNDGKMLWIASGLKVGTTVALNVGDTVPEGGKVRPIVEAKPQANATASATASATATASANLAKPQEKKE